MNLAVINTQSHEVRVFSGREQIKYAQFDRALSPEEVEYMRKWPDAFLEGIGAEDTQDLQDQLA